MIMERQESKIGAGKVLLTLFVTCLSFIFWNLAAFAGTPANIRETNVRGTQLSVSWTSVADEAGSVRYGTSIAEHAQWSTVNDDRGNATSDDIHHVTITGLTPDTVYFYEIISGGTTDNNGGSFYSVNPGPVLLPTGSCQPAGQVYKDQGKTQLAFDAIVYVTILGDTEETHSATESVLVTADTSGFWFLDLVNFRTKNLLATYSWTCGTSNIQVEAQGGSDGTARLTTTAIDSSVTFFR